MADKVDTEARRTSDKGAKELIGNKEDIKQAWEKLEKLEDLHIRLEKAFKPGFKKEVDVDKLKELYDQLVTEENELKGLVENLEYKGPLQIREYWEQEVSSEIDRLKLEVKVPVELRGITHKVELFKAQATREKGVSEQKAAELIVNIKKAQEKRLLTVGEATRLEKEVEEAVQYADRANKLTSKEVRDKIKENAEIFTPKVLENLKKLTPKIEKEIVELLQKEDNWSKEDRDSFLNSIKDDSVVKRLSDRVNDLIREGESDSRIIDDSIDVIEMANGIAKKEYRGVADKFEVWRKGVESQLRPEVMLEDAKREIIKAALERISRFGEGKTEMRVTNKDVETWVMGQMNRVIAGGEEATSYSARQYLSEVAGILEKSDLKFNDLISQMVRYIDPESGNLELESRGIKLNFKEEERVFLKELLKADHIRRADDNFKNKISAAIIVHELGNAHSRSGSAEDMVRISGVARTDQMHWVLEMNSVGRDVKGKLKFYEVEMDKDNKGDPINRQRVLSKEELNDAAFSDSEVEAMHTAEVNLGGLNLVVTKDGREIKTISSNEFVDLLQVSQQSVEVSTGDILDILNQERFAMGALSRRSNIAEKIKKEVVREAIMKNMGIVDIDGSLREDKLKELLADRLDEKDIKRVGFKLKNRNGKVIDNLDKVRVKMVMEQVGEKEMEFDGKGERSRVLGDGTTLWLDGMHEDTDSFDDMFHEYEMMFKLGDGMWRFMGLASAHWDKEFDGDTKDWHTKILHFNRYLQMFGIGPAHLRAHASVDYGDFITQRIKDINPDLFGDHTKEGTRNKDDEFERGELMKLLMKDKDGMFMSRQRFLDIFGRAKQMGGAKGDKFIKDILMEKAKYRFGDVKGSDLMDKHWKDIKEIDWSGVIDTGVGGDVYNGEVLEGKKKGFEGLYWYIKKNYTYENLKWGRGGHPTDTVWSQRIYKEAQYLLSAEQYRGKLLGWLVGEVSSPNKMLEAVSTPGYYANVDYTRKSQLFLRRWKEYFTRVGGGINPLATMETFKMSSHNNASILKKGKEKVNWDGSLNYEMERVGVGTCLAKRERGIGPFSYSQIGEVAEQFFRSGKLMPRYYQEIKEELVGFGNAVGWLNHGLNKLPLGLGKLINGALVPFIGGYRFKEIKVPFTNIVLAKDWYPSGILRWLLKKMWKYIADTWEVRREILQGAGKATGEQVGTIFKQE